MDNIEEAKQDTYRSVLVLLSRRANMNIGRGAYQMAREDVEAWEEISANISTIDKF